MLNRVVLRPISESDRIQPNYLKNPRYEKENNINIQSRNESILHPFKLPIKVYKPYTPIHPPALPIVKTAKHRFVDAIIKQPPVKISNDGIARRLRLAKAKAKARIRKIKLLAI